MTWNPQNFRHGIRLDLRKNFLIYNMWYYLVMSLGHLGLQRQRQLTEHAISKVTPFPMGIVVKEMGSNGTNYHLNILIEVKQSKLESSTKSFRQSILRGFQEGELTEGITVKGKTVKTIIGVANLICGYLTKEEAAKVLYTHNIPHDIKKHQKQRIEVKEEYSPVSQPQFCNLIINLYKEKYSHKPFNKYVYVDMFEEIGQSRNLYPIYRNNKSIYLALSNLLSKDHNSRQFLLDDLCDQK